ncbi:hypothetical protein FQA39_LY11104 [Lamprigera yunnana]|nr:hypothetical protein FQA39_LY11104 [Lamprigera yunnana]
MYSSAFYVFTVIALMAVIKNSSALQCWECSSDKYGRCADHFNTTLFPKSSYGYSAITSAPRVVNCDSGPLQYGQYGYQRQVCMKRLETDRRLGRTTYSRQCHTLVGNEKVGTCPTHITNPDVVVDFCEYCDTHECNGAGFLKSSMWMSVLLFIFTSVLRK